MGQFVRGSTDTIIGTVYKDISDASNIELWIDTFNEIFRRDMNHLTIAVQDDKTYVGYKMTQKESLSCCEDYVVVQLRWTYEDGTVVSTQKEVVSVDSSVWDQEINTDPDAEETAHDLWDAVPITRAELLEMWAAG